MGVILYRFVTLKVALKNKGLFCSGLCTCYRRAQGLRKRHSSI